MLRSLVGSEMCIRDSILRWPRGARSSPKGPLWPKALLPPERQRHQVSFRPLTGGPRVSNSASAACRDCSKRKSKYCQTLQQEKRSGKKRKGNASGRRAWQQERSMKRRSDRACMAWSTGFHHDLFIFHHETGCRGRDRLNSRMKLALWVVVRCFIEATLEHS